MSEIVGVFVCGAVFGGLVVAAWLSDKSPRSDIHASPDDAEQRARRVA